jgi:hypothetical protein
LCAIGKKRGDNKMSPNWPEPNNGNQKMKELILYISKHSMQDEKFGTTKLNKLLFYCDFEAFRKFGKAITGKEYQKLDEGPAPRCMLPIMEEMINIDKSMVISKATYFDKSQNRPIPLLDPKTDIFTPGEIELVDEIIERYRPLNAVEISRESHKFVGQRIMEFKETIPYSLALIGNRLPTEKEISYAYSLLGEIQSA